MKKLIVLMFVVLTVLAVVIPAFGVGEKPVAALSDALDAGETQEVIGSRVNVRAAASTSSAILGSLTKGDKVVVIEEKDGWVKIEWNGDYAYVAANFLTRPAAGASAETPAETSVNGQIAKIASTPTSKPTAPPKPVNP